MDHVALVAPRPGALLELLGQVEVQGHRADRADSAGVEVGQHRFALRNEAVDQPAQVGRGPVPERLRLQHQVPSLGPLRQAVWPIADGTAVERRLFVLFAVVAGQGLQPWPFDVPGNQQVTMTLVGEGVGFLPVDDQSVPVVACFHAADALLQLPRDGRHRRGP